MVTKKILIYTALTSTLLGGATTYFVIKNKAISSALGMQNYSLDAYQGISAPENEKMHSAMVVGDQNSSQASTELPQAYAQQDTQGNAEEGTPIIAGGHSVNNTNGENNAPTIVKSDYNIGTQRGYKLIKPMLWAKPAKESQAFSALKSQIINLIENDQRQHLLTSASVYLYSFADGEWTYVNPNESYNPGSLIKVPMLMAYLQMAEKDPKILAKKILCENSDYIPTQTYETHSINPGRIYTVKELLHSMIAYSDNNATNLLNKNVDLNIFRRTFTDLNIPEPDLADRNFQISAKRYSRFLIVLYNASYLSRSASETALQLLSECDFKDGMVKDLPSSVAVAHKFGEWGNNKINLHELSESGIVYYHDRPYLITVMTKGTNVKDLGPEISKISRMTYDFISSMGNPTL